MQLYLKFKSSNTNRTIMFYAFLIIQHFETTIYVYRRITGYRVHGK